MYRCVFRSEIFIRVAIIYIYMRALSVWMCAGRASGRDTNLIIREIHRSIPDNLPVFRFKCVSACVRISPQMYAYSVEMRKSTCMTLCASYFSRFPCPTDEERVDAEDEISRVNSRARLCEWHTYTRVKRIEMLPE